MPSETEKLNKKSISGTNGGARPGAGRPKGSLSKTTREKRAAEQEMIQRILTHLHPIIDAQLNLAKGVSYLYRIDETGEGKNKKREHVLVTDPDEIKDFLDENEGAAGVVDESYYYITTKAPDNKAIDSLLDRAFGKATQKSEVELNSDLPFNLTIVQKDGGATH